MITPDLTLYHYWRSSCSWRVRWAFAIKGLPYEAIPVNLLQSEQTGKNHLQRNPSGFVPSLQLGGQSFSESMALLEWLEESYPTPSLLSKDPLQRLRVREFSMKIASGIQPIQNLSVMRFHSDDQDKQRDWSKHWITKGLMACEKLLQGSEDSKFCFGDQLTFADLCLVPQVYNAKRFSVDMNLFPRLEEVYERALKTKTCQDSHPDKFKD